MYFWLWLNILMWEVHQFFRSYESSCTMSYLSSIHQLWNPKLYNKGSWGGMGCEGETDVSRNGSTCEKDPAAPSKWITCTPVNRIHIQPTPQWVGEPEHLHPHIYPATLHISCHILSTHVGVVTLLLSLLYWVSQLLNRGLNRVTPEV